MAPFGRGSSSTTRAATPFDGKGKRRKSANVILRASDGIEFRVQKHQIAFASPVLDELIRQASSSTSPPSSPGLRSGPRIRAVVDLPHPSDVLDLFLRFIFPVSEPTLTLDDVTVLLELAHKYDAESVRSRMRTHLSLPAHMEHDPTRIYALATYAGFNDIARVAARHTLFRAPEQDMAAVPLLSGAAFLRLTAYQRSCVRDAAEVARVVDAVPWWVQLQWRRFCFLSECGGECASVLPRRRLTWHKTLYGVVDVPQYWIDYMKGVREALMRKRLDPGAARDPALLRPAVEAGAKCSRCASKVYWDMDEFSKLLEEAIEEAISMVRLTFDDPDEDDGRSTRSSTTKCAYLLPRDHLVWPLYEYFNTYHRKLIQNPDDYVHFNVDEDSEPPDGSSMWQ
ncbi:hypothetical protein C8Q78DRAFT_1078038 [Trametes maxima]|nr:hypothetical protein C8Q78DRAFT_1078038 [Trametes maxima]